MKYQLLSAVVIALGMTACSETSKTGNETGDADTAVLLQNDETVKNDGQPGEMGSPNDDANWNDIDVIGAPAMKADEITDKDIEVRGNDQYGVYSVEERVLFDNEKSELRPGAEEKLKAVAASMNQRFKDGRVKIYGFTDSDGTAAYNMELSKARAEAVRKYLMTAANLTDDRISTYGMGETQPRATNSTEAGQQKNRRVRIVARKG